MEWTFLYACCDMCQCIRPLQQNQVKRPQPWIYGLHGDMEKNVNEPGRLHQDHTPQHSSARRVSTGPSSAVFTPTCWCQSHTNLFGKQKYWIPNELSVFLASRKHCDIFVVFLHADSYIQFFSATFYRFRSWQVFHDGQIHFCKKIQLCSGKHHSGICF